MRATKVGLCSGLLLVSLVACGGSDTDSSLFEQHDGGAGNGTAGSSKSDGAGGQNSGGQNSGGGQSNGDSSLGGAMGGSAGIPIEASNGDTTIGPDADAALVADGSDATTGDAVTADVTIDAFGDSFVEASSDVISEVGSVDGSGDAGCSGAVSCYGGAASELLAPATACRAGTSFCINGSSGSCIGEVRPTPEACNGLDDDCNGSIDDGLGTISCGVGACKNTVATCVSGKPSTCAPLPGAGGETCGDAIDNNCNGIVDEGCGCVYVGPNGNDTTGTGSSSLPFRTIGKAIASAGSNGLANQVCVAGSATCATVPSTTTYSESVAMRNGVSVLGGYSPVGVIWARSAGCVTSIQAIDPSGVAFDVSVTTPTVLDGFVVNAQATGTNAAITITGSTGAIVQADTINGGTGTSTVGILVQDSTGTKATPLIRDVTVIGGQGTASAIGISVINSAPTLSRNCSTFDTAGRCTSYGCSGATRYVRGRTAANNGAPGAQTYAVKLQGAAGTIVETSALCSSDGQGDVAGLRLSGASSGVVIRQNEIVAPAGVTGNINSVGVWMDACAGASPWILDNAVISGQSRTTGGRADGIRAVGDCHPRIDRNLRIVGGEESAANDAIGVYCAKDSQTAQSSRCTVLDNVAILGSGSGFPPTATGVRCDSGACARIERNGITGNQGLNTFGIVLNGAATFVDRNVIDAGCTSGEGIGLFSIDAPARVQNNVIRGGVSCVAGTTRTPTSTYATRVQIGTGLAEIDLHSNTLLAMGGTTCTSRALQFEPVGAAPSGPRGVVRNNILHAGVCSTAYGLVEASGTADPRILQNNDIWSPAGLNLYRDEGVTNLTTIAAVNGLTDITSSANISTDPLFVSATNFHLLTTSPCRNTGTATGAPGYDIVGGARPDEAIFDIGAYEFHP